MNTILIQLSRVREFFTKGYSSTQAFLCLFLINFFACFALLRDNVNYIDDIGRTAFGYKGWGNFSRFSSSGLAHVIHADSYLSDISPIPQLIALILISIAGIILIKAIAQSERISFLQIIAVLPLGLSPYFLECLSYKFDSPYMALSVLAAVLPFVVKERIWFMGAAFLSALLICTTYQASCGIFPMMLCFVCFIKLISKESPRKLILYFLFGLIGFLVGLVFFKLFVMVPANAYVSNQMFPIGDIFGGVIRNLKRYFGLLDSDSRALWRVCFFVFLCLFVFVSTWNSKINKFLSFLLSLCVLIAGGFFIFGFYAVLTKPLTAPRAMYGIGAFIAILSVYLVSSKDFYIGKLTSLIFVWSLFVFASTYGNALVAQKNFQEFRRHLVLNEINQLADPGKQLKLYVTGTVGHAPILKRAIQKYPILGRLVPITFRSSWFWGTEELLQYYGLKDVKFFRDYEGKYKEDSEPKYEKKHLFYDIKKSRDGVIEVNLK